jgi:ADP-ribosylglycohydrolase
MILNGIIGDVYGAPLEMMPHENIHEKYGKIMKEYIQTEKVIDRLYSYTDDTEMTLAVLNFIIDIKNNKITLTNENMLSYFIKYYEPSRGYSRNVNKLFLNYIETNQISISNSKGNGGLMRVSPISLICKYNEDLKILNYVTIIHYPTHIDDEAIQVSYLYVKILLKFKELYEIKEKKPLILIFIKELYEIATNNIKNLLKIIIDNYDLDNEYDMLYDFLDLDGVLCYQTLATALWCIVKNLDNPEKILAKGIFYGGDCDTIGAIIGQMSGILFGEISVNKDWLINIENLDKIYTLTGKISF